MDREIRDSETRTKRLREQRDRLVKQLRKSDPRFYTHKRLATIVGCSEELVAHILRDTKR